MILSIGSTGPDVRQLQDFLNKLSILGSTQLVLDGIFGTKTQARVKAFQGTNQLANDGIVGPLTLEAIQTALRLLGLLPTPSASAVRPINQQILGMAGVNNLIPQIIPSIGLIEESTFRPGDSKNILTFRATGLRSGRLGIFAAKKGAVERAVILLLPPTGVPDRVLICVTQGFGQADKHGELTKIGFGNPLSPEFIKFVLLKHVLNRWGAQTLASKKSMAFMYIVRSKGKELGPFASDGAFVHQTLTELVSLTNNAFTFKAVEAMTFSSGILDFNPFLASISSVLNVQAVYNIDPKQGISASMPAGRVRKQFCSGVEFGPKSGFEFMPKPRWKNESSFPIKKFLTAKEEFDYMHNLCMPLYALHLGIQTS